VQKVNLKQVFLVPATLQTRLSCFYQKFGRSVINRKGSKVITAIRAGEGGVRGMLHKGASPRQPMIRRTCVTSVLYLLLKFFKTTHK